MVHVILDINAQDIDAGELIALFHQSVYAPLLAAPIHPDFFSDLGLKNQWQISHAASALLQVAITLVKEDCYLPEPVATDSTTG